MNQPLVSVLITAYNREEFIAEAIESVLASDYQNFELIVVDDHSHDNTLNIAKRYENKFEKIKVYSNTQNLGQFPNRNRAASLASGKYLKYVDSDDVIKPNTLSIMVEAMESFGDIGIGVVYGIREKLDLSKKTFKVLNSELAYLWHYTNGGLLFPGPTGCIYNKENFLNQNGFPLDLGINADVYLNLKIAAISNVALFSNDLIIWRRHNQQVDQLQKNYLKMQKERYLIDRKILFDGLIPIKKNQLKKIRLSNKILYMRAAVNNFLVKGEFKKFMCLLSFAGIPVYTLPIALLPLRYINSLDGSLK